MNEFISKKRKYKFQGLFDSDKSGNEISRILHNMGFYKFTYEEINSPNPLKKTYIGRPLRYTKF